MTDFADDLGATLDAVWRMLDRAVRDKDAVARYPTLCTVDSHDWPQARTVVLRATDRRHARLMVHTDSASGKVGDLALRPRAQLHIWDNRASLQIRISVRVTLQTSREAANAWTRVPEVSRLAYGAEPAPGSRIAAPDDFITHPNPERFAVLACSVTRVETLLLADDGHRRALFEDRDDWAGTWLVP